MYVYMYFKVLLRVAESDEIAQETLNDDFKKNIINILQSNVTKEKFSSSSLVSPAEVIMNRINKRIQSSIRLIRLLHLDTEHTRAHIRKIDATIDALDVLRGALSQVDINFVRTKKTICFDIYEKLDKEYKSTKISQYPLFHYLSAWKQKLFKEEKEKNDYEYKCKLLENLLKTINNEIDSINCENQTISSENSFLRNQMADLKKVPAITNYAYIIVQTKKLRHEVDVWKKRVNIADVSLFTLNFIYSSTVVRHYLPWRCSVYWTFSRLYA